MADALLSGLVSTILGNLNSSLLQEFRISWGLKDEIRRLESTFTTIQAVLHDAEARQTKEEALQNWLRKLKDAAYDVDNILDDFATEALIQKEDRQRGVINQVSAFFTPRNPFVFRLRMAHKVKDIRERLDAIAGERFKFHLKEGAIDSQVYDLEGRQTSSLVVESDIYGRNDDKEMIIKVLLDNSSHQNDLSVYTIWGMGGLGKTTLAQLVYNDPRVRKHFELLIWVCVSEDFKIRRLTKAIIESIEGVECNISELDPLQKRLQEKLSGRRFLLVLDDVWNEENEKWDRLKDVLRCGAKGSMLIVTTRIEKIALMMATLPIFNLGWLSEDDSWILFKHRAFGIGRREESEENIELETIGKAIAKKCGGVPLAIKALGSLLRFKNNVSEWLSVKESATWGLADDENAIAPVLRLSYDNISPSLRQCFAYCSIFPKDYAMEVDMLIELWIANGFIHSKGETDLYRMGRGIFNNLDVNEGYMGRLTCKMHDLMHDLAMSIMIQECYIIEPWKELKIPEKEDYKGDLTCKMHDLMHDLAVSIMIQECYIIEPRKELKIPEKVRHLSFNQISNWMLPRYEVVLKVQSLRSILLLSSAMNEKDIATYISKQSNLRVLGLNNRYLNEVPSLIGNLKHLRYLNMSSSSINSLPESMTCLQNLQILKLKGCTELRELPKGMKNLRNLRCLDINGCNSLVCMPAGLGQLKHLQTLSIFIVGSDGGQQIGELEELNLSGELTIKGLHNVRDSEDARSANLKRKQDLCALILDYGDIKTDNLLDNDEEILDGELKELNLSGELTIKGLHNVRDSEDARSANLKRKQDLCALILDYGDIKTDNLLDNDEEILDGLQPHPNLKKLSIWSYQGLKFPNWMLDLDLQNLIEISLVGCKRCEHLPPLGKLPSLKVLFIGAMDAFKCFNNDCYGDGEQSFPALEKLSFSAMHSLEEWTTVDRGENFPRLRELYIRQCPRLTEFPCLPSLGRLSIENSNEMLLRSVMDLTSLSWLEISRFDGLEFLPDGLLQNHKVLEFLWISGLRNLKTVSHQLDNLSALKELTINCCNSLEYLPDGLKNLRSLERLELRDCDSLTSLPATGLQGLSSLRSLSIQHCKKLSCLSEGVKHLTALQNLVIISCPEMTSLPEDMQHLNALRELMVWSCNGLVSLPNWLGSLMSLSTLEIGNWPNLISLPDGMQSLKTLYITGCPHLERRCEKEKGEDWPKIAHVREIRINGWKIQSLIPRE
ncbi:unnamed protein product [Ilex paraguariensis]|uniref:Disease resistance protein RGA3 n=1 Tax=Ilex paraguariensis TaxID=185542 RepID=A0ABC8TLN5_9AQUA